MSPRRLTTAISICVPSECGGSGIQSYRYKVEGKIFNFNTSAYAKADRVYGQDRSADRVLRQGQQLVPGDGCYVRRP